MKRSPGLAGVLSVPLPGLGHLYAGATARGLALAAASVALMHAELAAVVAVWIFGIVNAIRTTEEIVRAHAEGRPAAVALDRNWAVALMATGVIATLALVPELEWLIRFWPLVLVWIGVQLFRGRPLIPGSPVPAAGSASGATAAATFSAAGTADPPPPPPAADPVPDPPPEKTANEEN